MQHRQCRCRRRIIRLAVVLTVSLLLLIHNHIQRLRSIDGTAPTISWPDGVNPEIDAIPIIDAEGNATEHPKAERHTEVAVVSDDNAHWELHLSSEGELGCRIHTNPINSNNETSTPVRTEEYTIDDRKEQYVIHVHGLHFTGTGYLRQTLHDALNREFSADDDDVGASSPPAASMQHSERPRVPEDEGQHLQTVYPKFLHRTKLLRLKFSDNGRGGSGQRQRRLASALPYLTESCSIVNDDDDDDDDGGSGGRRPGHGREDDRRIGNALLRQWMPFWDRSATFLIQKTPTLDVAFLERVKILPTLHVMVVRHPMTRNPYKHAAMGTTWANTWAHVLETLRRGDVEWYAVVTYEALIAHRDEVVRELMEVVRSGMRRHRGENDGGGGRTSTTGADDAATSSDNARRFRAEDGRWTSSRPRPRRRLHYHEGGASDHEVDASYLAPKEESVALWGRCLNATRCGAALRRLTRHVLPYFGYVSERRRDGAPLLSSAPGTVTASRDFGRVLFSSEGDALNEFRRSRGDVDGRVDYQPPLDLISKMKEFSRVESNSG